MLRIIYNCSNLWVLRILQKARVLSLQSARGFGANVIQPKCSVSEESSSLHIHVLLGNRCLVLAGIRSYLSNAKSNINIAYPCHADMLKSEAKGRLKINKGA